MEPLTRKSVSLFLQAPERVYRTSPDWCDLLGDYDVDHAVCLKAELLLHTKKANHTKLWHTHVSKSRYVLQWDRLHPIVYQVRLFRTIVFFTWLLLYPIYNIWLAPATAYEPIVFCLRIEICPKMPWFGVNYFQWKVFSMSVLLTYK